MGLIYIRTGFLRFVHRIVGSERHFIPFNIPLFHRKAWNGLWFISTFSVLYRENAQKYENQPVMPYILQKLSEKFPLNRI